MSKQDLAVLSTNTRPQKNNMTTSQKQFFAQRTLPQRWVIPFGFDVSNGYLHPHFLKQSVDALVKQHDILRTAFIRKGQNIRMIVGQNVDSNIYRFHDIATLSTAQQLTYLENNWHASQVEFDVFNGPFIKVELYNLGDRQSLHVFFHHAVLDGISALTILEDLKLMYSQLSQSHALNIRPASVSVPQLMDEVAEYTAKKIDQAEYQYWQSLPWDRALSLPLDTGYRSELNTYASTRRISFSFDEETTSKLMRALPGLTIHDILVFALVETVSTFTGEDWVQLVSVDARGQLLCCQPSTDISKVLGWISMWRRLVLPMPEGMTITERLNSFFHSLMAVPDRGIGFELMRHSDDFPAIAEQLKSLANEHLMLNFLGRLEDMPDTSNVFGQSCGFQGPIGVERDYEEQSIHPESDQGERETQTLVSAYLKQSCLHVHWEYSCQLSRRATVERYVATFKNSINSIVTSLSFND